MAVEPKEKRKTLPRKVMKTKEEIEMMNHGLMDVNNIPITDHEEIRNSRNYGRRLRIISEIMYQQTIVYQWRRTRGKRNTTCGPDQFQCGTKRCISERWKYNILSDCDDGTGESPECVPLVRHPGPVSYTHLDVYKRQL